MFLSCGFAPRRERRNSGAYERSLAAINHSIASEKLSLVPRRGNFFSYHFLKFFYLSIYFFNIVGKAHDRLSVCGPADKSSLIIGSPVRGISLSLRGIAPDRISGHSYAIPALLYSPRNTNGNCLTIAWRSGKDDEEARDDAHNNTATVFAGEWGVLI